MPRVRFRVPGGGAEPALPGPPTDIGVAEVGVEGREPLRPWVLGPDAFGPAEVVDPGPGRDAGAGEHHHAARPNDEAPCRVDGVGRARSFHRARTYKRRVGERSGCPRRPALATTRADLQTLAACSSSSSAAPGSSVPRRTLRSTSTWTTARSRPSSR